MSSAQFLDGNLPCPCCFPAIGYTILTAILLVLTIADSICIYLTKSRRRLRVVYRVLQILVCLLALSLALLCGFIARYPDVGMRLFAKFCAFGSKNQSAVWEDFRCKDIRNVKGRILELGPGAGANFICWKNNTEITEWVGIDPNVHFSEALDQNYASAGLSFPKSIKWMKGEDLDIEPHSFDVVIGTHVLCSVDDVSAVLKQVERALKPATTAAAATASAAEQKLQQQQELTLTEREDDDKTTPAGAGAAAVTTAFRDGATFYSLEHVQASKVHDPYLHLFQAFVSPMQKILFSGCQFHEIRKHFLRESVFNALSTPTSRPAESMARGLDPMADDQLYDKTESPPTPATPAEATTTATAAAAVVDPFMRSVSGFVEDQGQWCGFNVSLTQFRATHLPFFVSPHVRSVLTRVSNC